MKTHCALVSNNILVDGDIIDLTIDIVHFLLRFLSKTARTNSTVFPFLGYKIRIWANSGDMFTCRCGSHIHHEAPYTHFKNSDGAPFGIVLKERPFFPFMFSCSNHCIHPVSTLYIFFVHIFVRKKNL